MPETTELGTEAGDAHRHRQQPAVASSDSQTLAAAASDESGAAPLAETCGEIESASSTAAASAAASSGGPSNVEPASNENGTTPPIFSLDEIASSGFPELKRARSKLRREAKSLGRHEQFQRMRATLAALTSEESPPTTTPTRVQLQVPPSAPTRTERRKVKSIFQVAPAEASAWELPTPTFTDKAEEAAQPQALF
jgi:hypothetical protein